MIYVSVCAWTRLLPNSASDWTSIWQTCFRRLSQELYPYSNHGISDVSVTSALKMPPHSDITLCLKVNLFENLKKNTWRDTWRDLKNTWKHVIHRENHFSGKFPIVVTLLYVMCVKSQLWPKQPYFEVPFCPKHEFCKYLKIRRNILNRTILVHLRASLDWFFGPLAI